jgi:hypothetical protein
LTTLEPLAENAVVQGRHDVVQLQAPGWDDVVCAVSRRVSSPVCDEVAILGLDQEIYRGLNPTGARIWELVRSPIKVSEIHRTIVEEYGVDEETARKELLDELTQLQHAALIEVRGGGSRSGLT